MITLYNPKRSAMELTEQFAYDWNDVCGWAPDTAANRISKSNFDLLIEYTRIIESWNETGNLLIERNSSDSEEAKNCNIAIISLGYIILGIILEFWLRAFLSLFYEDYIVDPCRYKTGASKKSKDPANDMTLAELINYCSDPVKGIGSCRLHVLNDSTYRDWADRIRRRRNAVHSFQAKTSSFTVKELSDDIEHLQPFIYGLIFQLPDPTDR